MATSDTLNKNDTQQKKDHLKKKRKKKAPFEKNGPSQEWYMTNTPTNVEKYSTHKKMVSYKNGAILEKNAQRSFAKGLTE